LRTEGEPGRRHQRRPANAPYSLDGSGATRSDLEPIFNEYLSVFNIELEDDAP
jgi:hypothetical protein